MAIPPLSLREMDCTTPLPISVFTTRALVIVRLRDSAQTAPIYGTPKLSEDEHRTKPVLLCSIGLRNETAVRAHSHVKALIA